MWEEGFGLYYSIYGSWFAEYLKTERQVLDFGVTFSLKCQTEHVYDCLKKLLAKQAQGQVGYSLSVVR